jgi:hypothetical protein
VSPASADIGTANRLACTLKASSQCDQAADFISVTLEQIELTEDLRIDFEKS